MLLGSTSFACYAIIFQTISDAYFKSTKSFTNIDSIHNFDMSDCNTLFQVDSPPRILCGYSVGTGFKILVFIAIYSF